MEAQATLVDGLRGEADARDGHGVSDTRGRRGHGGLDDERPPGLAALRLDHTPDLAHDPGEHDARLPP